MPASASKPEHRQVRETETAQEASDGSSPSSSGSSSGSDLDSDGSSDSEASQLDHDGPRKRRRLSPSPVNEKSASSVFSAPSRIGAKPSQEIEAPSGKPPAKRVLAPTDPNTTFDSLGVAPWLVQSLSNMAIQRPTSIQKLCIPEILKSGRDCIGSSRTVSCEPGRHELRTHQTNA